MKHRAEEIAFLAAVFTVLFIILSGSCWLGHTLNTGHRGCAEPIIEME